MLLKPNNTNSDNSLRIAKQQVRKGYTDIEANSIISKTRIDIDNHSYLCYISISGATGALIVAHITSGVSAGLKVAVSLLITGLVSALTIGGKAAGKGIAVMCSSKVLALCGRVLSVLPLKLDNRK